MASISACFVVTLIGIILTISPSYGYRIKYAAPTEESPNEHPFWFPTYIPTRYSYFATTTATDAGTCEAEYEGLSEEDIFQGYFGYDNTFLMEQFEATGGEVSICQVRTRGEGEEAKSTFTLVTGQIEPLFKFNRNYNYNVGGDSSTEDTIALEP